MIGYEYFSAEGIDWRKHQGAVIPLSMPHVEPTLSEEKAVAVLAGRKGYFIRWETEFDALERGSWWHVIKSEREKLGSLSGNTRSKIRRGLKNFGYQLTSSEVICEQAYPVYRDAYNRYQTFEKMLTEKAFRKAVSTLPRETEFWLATDSETGEVAAFSENLVRDGAAFYLTMWFSPPALRKYVSYGLIHAMNTYYLNDQRLDYVSDGARSISHQTTIHDFLIDKFGFRKAYATLHVVYARWLYPGVRGLYPLRGLVSSGNISAARKVAVLFEQERLRRACMREGAG